MSFITWDEQYAIDVDEVDEQHRRLFELINEFYEAMQEGRAKDDVGETLEALEEYVDYHFSSERDLAVDCGFSDDCSGCHEAHQAAHDEFADRVTELRALHEEGDATVHMKTLRFLRKWLTQHIGSMDQQLGEYIHGTANPEELDPLTMEVSRE